MRTAMTLLAVLALGAGCKKKDSEPPPANHESGSSTMTVPSGSSTAPAPTPTPQPTPTPAPTPTMTGSATPDDSGVPVAMSHRAGNCPSMVLGSKTRAALKGKDVVLTITSDDPDAILAIQRRTDEVVKDKVNATPSAGHDQKGTHGGSMGRCPVEIPEGATATAKHDKHGVTIAITASDPAALKKDVDDRIERAAEWVKNNIKPGDKGDQGGVGGGKGDHGSNHSGQGDAKGQDRKGGGGGGGGTGGGGGKGTGGGGGSASTTPLIDDLRRGRDGRCCGTMARASSVLGGEIIAQRLRDQRIDAGLVGLLDRPSAALRACSGTRTPSRRSPCRPGCSARREFRSSPA